MTDAQLRDAALLELMLTTTGYINPNWTKPPVGTHWRNGLDLLAQIGGITPPPPPPPPNTSMGTGLPQREPVSTGSTVHVTSLAEIKAAFATALNQTVMLTMPVDLAGQTLDFNRYLNLGQTVTFDEATSGLLRNGSFIITGSHFRTHVAVQNATIDGIKLTYSSANPRGCGNIDVDLRGKIIQSAKRQGVNVQLPHGVARIGPWQIWNVRVKDSGTTTNLDHGIYVAVANPGDVIANFSSVNGQAYGIQSYPDDNGLIVTMASLDGGRTRGGVVVGSETGLSKNNKFIGILVTRPSGAPFTDYNNAGPTNMFEDCASPNGPGNVNQVNFSTNLNHLIDPARYPLVPPLDIDGNPRPATPRVGCLA